ncbi:MAG: hypothetical protein PVI75_00680 [Gammaproteobacteria bacterium]|jgi:hypothetical protein
MSFQILIGVFKKRQIADKVQEEIERGIKTGFTKKHFFNYDFSDDFNINSDDEFEGKIEVLIRNETEVILEGKEEKVKDFFNKHKNSICKIVKDYQQKNDNNEFQNENDEYETVIIPHFK